MLRAAALRAAAFRSHLLKYFKAVLPSLDIDTMEPDQPGLVRAYHPGSRAWTP